MLRSKKLDIPGAYLLETEPFQDHRGSLSRLFCQQIISQLGFTSIKQINITNTVKAGTIRGLHFQEKPFEEAKIVSCLRGDIFDVIVDIRLNSPNFGRYLTIKLSERDTSSLLVPEGFAHGFQSLTNDVQVLYFHSKNFEQSAQRGVNAKDPELQIPWPMTVTDISEKDKRLPTLSEIRC